MAQTTYRNVSGRRLGNRSSLWLASDHLLHARRESCSESYQRFSLRDIQALFHHPTRRRTWYNLLLLVPIVSMGLISLAMESPQVGLVGLVIFGTPMVWNMMQGPGCKCYIRTAVQTSQLQAITRRAQANALIATLEIQLTKVQGELTDLQRDALRGGSGSIQSVIEAWQDRQQSAEAEPQPAAEAGAEPAAEAEGPAPAAAPEPERTDVP